MDDPYRVLGVARDADETTIKAAYRKLAKRYHPDRNPGDAEAERRFREAAAAYELLGDPQRRRRFEAGEIDAEGRERAPFGFGGGFGGRGDGASGGFRGAGGFAQGDVEDLINELFGGRFGGSGRGRARGADVRARLAVDFLEAARGGRSRVTLPTGRTVEVTLPPGAEDGQTLRLRGQGEPGRGGGGAGDMLVELSVRPHPRFRRDGRDIHLDWPVPLAVAVLGGRVEVPTLDGEARVRVKKGTDGGTTLRLRGKGIRADDGAAGDLFVRLVIALPDPPDAELERWAARRTEDAAPSDAPP